MRFGQFVFPVSHDPENDGAVIDSTLREIELADSLGFELPEAGDAVGEQLLCLDQARLRFVTQKNARKPIRAHARTMIGDVSLCWTQTLLVAGYNRFGLCRIKQSTSYMAPWPLISHP